MHRYLQRFLPTLLSFVHAEVHLNVTGTLYIDTVCVNVAIIIIIIIIMYVVVHGLK